MNTRVLVAVVVVLLGGWAAATLLDAAPRDDRTEALAPEGSDSHASDPITRDPEADASEAPQPLSGTEAGEPVGDPAPTGEEPMDEQQPEVPPHPTAKMPKLKLTEKVTTTDGSRKLTLYVNPRVLVQFDVHKKRRVPPVKGAEPIGTGVTTWLWLLPEGQSSVQVAATLNKKKGGGTWAALMHDGPSTASPQRAANGEIVLQFEKAWKQEDVDAFAKAEEIEGLRPMSIPGWYVFAVHAGMSAIKRANALQQRKGVKSAAPSWWRPRVWK